MKIIWTEPSLNDVESIWNFIASDSKNYASSFVSEIIKTIDTLLVFPRLGRVVSKYNDDNIRELIYRNYRIIYKIENDAIFILTITEGSKELNS